MNNALQAEVSAALLTNLSKGLLGSEKSNYFDDQKNKVLKRMNYTDIGNYWAGGFNFDRTHITRNKVAIQTYKLLMHYTKAHKNCRVGCYLMYDSFSTFYGLSQLIPSFDSFADVAENNKQVLKDSYPNFIKDATGITFHEQVEKVWRLKYPICFEFTTKTFLGDVFGYGFKHSLTVKIFPEKISKLEGESMDSFRLTTDSFLIDIAFGKQITIQ
ncbi:MAG: hypothetical protein RIE86_00040 [Imperialibacter sp.]|uniref:hypothetical protein n=1 Tax=Imperialibacter sp. TaxID=2038411 RepID=UPI0032EB1299